SKYREGDRILPACRRAGCEEFGERRGDQPSDHGREAARDAARNARARRAGAQAASFPGCSTHSHQGICSEGTRDSILPARDLCRKIGEPPELFTVLFGLFTFHLVRGEPRTARELGEQLLGLAERAKDPGLLVEAHFTLGCASYFLGEQVT